MHAAMVDVPQTVPPRTIEPWMTHSPGPFVTIRPGGPLQPVVTITAESQAVLSVEAEWNAEGDRRRASAILNGYSDARRLAHAWADLLVIGREPEAA
jgi:hypothetical protein